MKLTNPTDDQLNAAFAERIAAWRDVKNGILGWNGRDPDMPFHSDGGGLYMPIPEFTTSADAVLPWLEKGRDNGRRIGCEMGFRRWRIWIHEKQPDGLYNSSIEREPDGDAETFPRSAVIALLRANGVEVEFAQG